MRTMGPWRARFAAPLAAAVLGGAGATVVAVAVVNVPPAAAATIGPVDPTIPDNSPNSLRNVLESQISPGDTVVLQAGATYNLTHCSDADIDIRANVTINGNGATIKSTCPNNEGGVLDTDSALTLNSVVLTGGSTTSDNGGAISDFGGALVINNSAIIGNSSTCDGGGVYHGASGGTTITNSTIANNTASGVGGGVYVDTGEGLVITNSTISNNTASEGGGIEAGTSVHLIYTTLVDNTNTAVPGSCDDSVQANSEDNGRHATHHASIRPQVLAGVNLNVENIDGVAPLSSFGTVIALPHGGSNCAGGGSVPLVNTSSAGFNYSDDASCAFGSSTDKQQGADPQLAALAANGGLGPTRLPQSTSPLVNVIPISSCGGGNTLAGFTVTTDERGVSRPQGSGCEIGAVEIVPPLVVQP